MRKYFYLQIKRLLKILPPLLIACLVISVALGIFLGGMIENDKNDAKNQKFKISVVGSTKDNYLSMGITALETLDSTRFAVEIEQTDEKTAKKTKKPQGRNHYGNTGGAADRIACLSHAGQYDQFHIQYRYDQHKGNAGILQCK